jgi:hypothetical protein
MGYALITYENMDELVQVANLAKMALYRDAYVGAQRDKLWLAVFTDGMAIVHECTGEPAEVDAALQQYSVPVKVLNGSFEWVK